ncbi:hypothetical protein NLG97_g7981 [Lecanicillium saksenae]|uniref:Uncharacterized protein n=1 Tax=Lecanicillium saksenae TaxID=468837 RepID=A0ACC1QP34_9HYPO|nr:hypothetical protein NLG97_g7981 [Lecanicillium saksenae]
MITKNVPNYARLSPWISQLPYQGVYQYPPRHQQSNPASHVLASDNVINFEVILANGTIVNANWTSNKDLWAAVKGGSGNIGLVTRFDTSVIEYPGLVEPVLWGGSLTFDLAAPPGVIESLVRSTNDISTNENCTAERNLDYAPQSGGTTLMVSFDNSLATHRPSIFDHFYNVEGITEEGTGINSLLVVKEGNW